MLTETQLRTLQRARDTLTVAQEKLRECTSRDFDVGRVVQACAAAELALFEVVSLCEQLQEMEKALAQIDL